ncbi:hypothetical protein LXM94_23640 [Rhizobium sp. TRM95111]|uniref:hypothetical protein n=1 Tax=Rhizobium alarense TaxID=2846851 RepID=UPI001F245EDA|nr:hypothetical protein [Rhizobium alarense]MCF3642961.1 hypothetical protein [Rhizobium alarense]
MIVMNATEQRALQMQRRAGVDATSEQGAAIANLVAQIDAEKEAYRSAKEAGDFMRDNLKRSFEMLIPEIETGNDALDSFINNLMRASQEAIFFNSGPLAGIFGNNDGDGGFLTSLFGLGSSYGASEPFASFGGGPAAGPHRSRQGQILPLPCSMCSRWT